MKSEKNLPKIMRLICIIFFFLFSNNFLFAANPYTASPRWYDTETTLGAGVCDFVWFRDGIKLSSNIDLATPCTLETKRGSTGINLQANTLTLSSDIFLGDKVLLQGSGTILGRPADFTGDTFSLVLTGTAKIVAANTILVNDLTIDGLGNSFDFNGGVLSIVAGKTLTLRNIILKNVTAGSIVFGASSVLNLDNVLIELTGVYNFSGTTPFINIFGNVLITGPGKTFQWDSGTITQNANSTLTFDVGTTFDVNQAASITGDATSVTYFNGCTIDITAQNSGVSVGYVLFDNLVHLVGPKVLDLSGCTVKILSGARVQVETSSGDFKV